MNKRSWAELGIARSETAVRKYKRSNSVLMENVSKVLDPPKMMKFEDPLPPLIIQENLWQLCYLISNLDCFKFWETCCANCILYFRIPIRIFLLKKVQCACGYASNPSFWVCFIDNKIGLIVYIVFLQSRVKCHWNCWFTHACFI